MDYILIIITVYIVLLIGGLFYFIHNWTKRAILGMTGVAFLVPLWMTSSGFVGGMFNGGKLIDAEPEPTKIIDGGLSKNLSLGVGFDIN